MSRLRDDVRTAFEREQAALGDVADARHRLLHSVLAEGDQPVSRGLQWAAAVAAVLIAAIVIATFAIAKANNPSRAVPAATPSPSAAASPTPLANHVTVPDSTPLILYQDPANIDQLDGVTWDGKTSGKVGAGAGDGGAGNLQGTYYTTMTDIRDRSGNVLAPYSTKSGFIIWADDGVHFCEVVRTASPDVAGPGILRIGAPNQTISNVAQVGSFGPITSDTGAPTVIACSPEADRAVVYQTGGEGRGVTQFWVIQLSTGRTLWQGGAGDWIAASHDGRYVALNAAPGQPTTIFGADGSVEGQAAGMVFAFSWDGSVAVVADGFAAAPSTVDWRTGHTIWTCPNGAFKYWQAFPEPGGAHIAIGVRDPAYPQTRGLAPVDLFVVGTDGAAVFEMKDVTVFQR